MLSSNQVRVRHAKDRLIPLYINEAEPEWRDAAQRLLELFRTSVGSPRSEIEEDIAATVGDSPKQIVQQGLAKLLEDRCEFDVESSHPPDELRERVFLLAAEKRKAGEFERMAVLSTVADELTLTAEQIDRGLFADLKGEQRLIAFEEMSVEQLLERYNVALAQAILIRSTGMRVRIAGETPARFRQIIRAIKFHRLICRIDETGKDTYTLHLDGPLSLFSSTSKYGVQLANFLPTLLHCKSFTLNADIKWGAQRKDKQFELDSSEKLKSHTVDYGDYMPAELTMFAEQFRKQADGWKINAEGAFVSLPSGLWAPDFVLEHTASRKKVSLEILGFWRHTDARKLFDRLKREMRQPFLLAVSEAMNTDDGAATFDELNIYQFKRTPIAGEIIRRALALVSG